jgi:hypothetical protein
LIDTIPAVRRSLQQRHSQLRVSTIPLRNTRHVEDLHMCTIQSISTTMYCRRRRRYPSSSSSSRGAIDGTKSTGRKCLDLRVEMGVQNDAGLDVPFPGPPSPSSTHLVF